MNHRYYYLIIMISGALILTGLFYFSGYNSCKVNLSGLGGVPFNIKTASGIQFSVNPVLTPAPYPNNQIISGFSCQQTYIIYEDFYYYPNTNQTFTFNKTNQTVYVKAPI